MALLVPYLCNKSTDMHIASIVCSFVLLDFFRLPMVATCMPDEGRTY